MYHVAICDDDMLVRMLIRTAVERSGAECLISEFADGAELIDGYEGYDVLFLDIDMPVTDGHPFSFLLKPVDEEEIRSQFKEACEYGGERRQKGPLRFTACEGVVEMDVYDIYYMEYVGRKIRMVTKSGEYYLRGKITVLAQRMEAYGFAAPHKSFTVNLYHVKSIRGYDIHMMNGDIIPLSQKRSAQFRGRLGRRQAEYI